MWFKSYRVCCVLHFVFFHRGLQLNARVGMMAINVCIKWKSKITTKKNVRYHWFSVIALHMCEF